MMDLKKIFQLSCESPVDINYQELLNKDIKILSYKYTINDTTYIDDCNVNDTLQSFYSDIEKGLIPKTTQTNAHEYYEYFKSILDNGKNIIHITLGTGMTNSYNNALCAKSELEKEYPDKTIIIIDSLCSSTGYGLLVLKVNEMMEENKPLQDILSWIELNKTRIHHQFFTTDLSYYKRTERVCNICAFVSNALKICPIMRLNHDGKIVAYNKAFGKSMAMKRTIDEMEKHCNDGFNYHDSCFITHSNCYKDATLLKEKIEEKFLNLKGKIKIYDIGKIIASHCGPGTVAVFFFGDERKK